MIFYLQFEFVGYVQDRNIKSLWGQADNPELEIRTVRFMYSPKTELFPFIHLVQKLISRYLFVIVQNHNLFHISMYDHIL